MMKTSRVARTRPPYRRALAGVLLLSFGTLVACPRVESCRCEATANCVPPEVERKQLTPQLATEVQDGAVYLDLSQTMRGFIAEQGFGIPFSHLQELLRTTLPEAFVEVDLGMPAFRGFGGQMVDSSHLAPMLYYAIRSPDGTSPRQRYNQGQTDIVRMLERSADAPGTLSVIVTDNAQDVLRSGGSRVPGFDRSSFVKVVTERLHSQSFGVWLIGIQDDFQGNYFSIQPIFDQDGVKLNNPIPLKGRRPFYCWVVSKDVEKGRRFVQHLLQRLPVQDVGAIELAPGILPDFRIDEPDGEAFANDNSARWFQVQDWLDGPASSFICLSFKRNEQSKQHRFPLLGIITHAPEKSLRSRLRLPNQVWHLEVRPKGNTSHLQGFQFPKLDGNLVATLGEGALPDLSRLIVLNPATLAASEPAARYLDLELLLAADISDLPESHWISAWSTQDDTTPDSIEGKTLYLEDIVLGILRSTLGEARSSRCLRLCFASRSY